MLQQIKYELICHGFEQGCNLSIFSLVVIVLMLLLLMSVLLTEHILIP